MSSEITPEFSHAVPLSEIGGKAVTYRLAARESERSALAKRFDLLSLETLEATLTLAHDDRGIMAKGHFSAALTQACVASGLPVPAEISEPFAIRFMPEEPYTPDAEIELEPDDCDTIFHDGRVVDLGEAVAQTLGLAINPFPRSPDADAVLKKAGVLGEHEAGPFAALAALRKDAD